MGMGFAPTWLRQVSPPPLLHKTTLTTGDTVRKAVLRTGPFQSVASKPVKC